jgi:hypothetical protein
VVVPGVSDPVRGVEADLVPHAALTTCRLHVEPAELGRRLAARGRPTDDLAAEFADADALDRAFGAALCVDTTGRTVAEVVDRVRARTGWPDPAAPVDTPSPTQQVLDPAPGKILWLCGPPAVGKSTVGWQVYRQVRRAGVNAAFVDLDQVGFRRPVPAGDPGNHRLKAANLDAVWRAFRASGSGCLIAVGPVDRSEDVVTYRAALPAATITLCRLHASRHVLADRIARRGRGLTPTWGLAGDELIGQRGRGCTRSPIMRHGSPTPWTGSGSCAWTPTTGPRTRSPPRSWCALAGRQCPGGDRRGLRASAGRNRLALAGADVGQDLVH